MSLNARRLASFFHCGNAHYLYDASDCDDYPQSHYGYTPEEYLDIGDSDEIKVSLDGQGEACPTREDTCAYLSGAVRVSYDVPPVVVCVLEQACDADLLEATFPQIKSLRRVQPTVFTIAAQDALDFLWTLVHAAPLYQRNTLEVYAQIFNLRNPSEMPGLSVEICDSGAVFPTKANGSDIGLDLTIIREAKRLNERTVLYDTGVALHPSLGWYVQVVPRSSLSKTGYMMANSIGIIDPGYTGTIMIALTKVDDSAPDIQLPLRCAQILMTPAVYAVTTPVEKLHMTARGAGGFGSSG
jgi:deoxyuridine 5'-triphosphate nucleotidohydrolase